MAIFKSLKNLYVKIKSWFLSVDKDIEHLKKEVKTLENEKWHLQREIETLRESISPILEDVKELKRFTGYRDKEKVNAAIQDLLK